MRLYSNVYDYDIYTLNYYEDQYFISLFKHTVKYMINARMLKLL